MVFICVDILPLCLCAMCIQFLWGPEKGVRSSGTGVYYFNYVVGGCTHECKCPQRSVVSEPIELELQVVMSSYVCVRNHQEITLY